MPTICPKCRAVRPASTEAPDWQCPSCGVAYAKVGGVSTAPSRLSSGASMRGANASRSGKGLLASIPWVKLLAVYAIAYGAWAGLRHWDIGSASEGLSRVGHFGTAPSSEQLQRLAAGTQPSDVLIYSAAWCTNCAAAKGWMAQYGFKYQECDVEGSSACAAQLKQLDAQGGIPYLIVKGRHMKDGFDSDEFLALLTR
jgi:glutaredoxin